MMMRIGLATAAALVLAVPSAASAATVAVDAGALSYTAEPGEINDVTIERAGGLFRITDSTAPLTTADAECDQVTDHLVRCAAAEVDTIDGVGRDQSDEITVIAARPATLTGGSGGDTLEGGDGNDVLIANSGGPFTFQSETLRGGAGSDELRGTTTSGISTQMLGGPGDDTLIGGRGFDNMTGNEGADEFIGGLQNDSVGYSDAPAGVTVTMNDVANDGPPGENDNVHSDVETLSGSSFSDSITATSGRNSIFANAGSDTVRAVGGNDFIDGGEDGDVLQGGEGEDSLQGGTGAAAGDVYFGGADVDTVLLGQASGSPTNITIDNVANDGEAGENDNVRTDVENVSGSPGPDTIVGSAEDNELTGGDGDDALTGGGGDDVLSGDFTFGTPGDDGLVGGAGDDLLNGGGNADDLRGSTGFDVVTFIEETASPTSITIDGVPNDGAAGEGDNVRTDIESVAGSQGVDDITGSSAPEILFGLGDADIVNGGGGDDLLDGEGPRSNDIAGDVLVGGTGVDGVSYGTHFNPVNVDTDDVADDGEFNEGDRVRSTVENLFGGFSDDQLTGAADANILDGGPGFGGDTLTGLGGPDFLSGGESFDQMSGGGGNDRLNSRNDANFDIDDCGPQTDSVDADPTDMLIDCETVFNPAKLGAWDDVHTAQRLQRSWETSRQRLARATRIARRAD